jgi:hypothetical protein
MYTKDKKIRLTIRLDKQSSDFVEEQSRELGLTPSSFVRQMIYTQMYAQKTITKVITQTLNKELESSGKASNNENSETHINNLV